MIRAALLVTPLIEPLLDAVLRLKLQFWNYSIDAQIAWFNANVKPDDWHVIAFDERGSIIGYTRVVLAKLDRKVAIIDTMCVDREFQKRGVGRLVMQTASVAIREDRRIGLLSCAPEIGPFYSSCGWVSADEDERQMAKSFPKILHADQMIMSLPVR